MKKKLEVISLLGILLMTSCGENKINYYQEYVRGYVYYKIPSEKKGFNIKNK